MRCKACNSPIRYEHLYNRDDEDLCPRCIYLANHSYCSKEYCCQGVKEGITNPTNSNMKGDGWYFEYYEGS